MSARIRKLLPHCFSLLNLSLGVLAVLLLVLGNGEIWEFCFVVGACCVFVAAVCDVFDGAAARYFHQEEEFGRVLDSLSDVVSFGVAPAVLFSSQFLLEFHFSAYFVFPVALIFPLSGALRLAKFHSLENVEGFVGLPIPVAAVAVVLVLSFNRLPDFFGALEYLGLSAFPVHWLLTLAVFLLYAALMNSPVPFPKTVPQFFFFHPRDALLKNMAKLLYLCFAVLFMKLFAFVYVVIYTVKPLFSAAKSTA